MILHLLCIKVTLLLILQDRKAFSLLASGQYFISELLEARVQFQVREGLE